jgi:hypothetical protein
MKTFNLTDLIAKNPPKYPFSKKSLKKLVGVDTRLVDLLFDAAEYMDLKIIEGHRTVKQQNALYRAGKSTKDGYINSSNHQWGVAVDVLPLPRLKGYPLNMYQASKENDLRWAYFTGFIQALGIKHNLKVRTGWKWRSNPQKTLSRPIKENTFPDYNHIEIQRTK